MPPLLSKKYRAKILQLGASQRRFPIATATAKSENATLSAEARPALHTDRMRTGGRRNADYC